MPLASPDANKKHEAQLVATEPTELLSFLLAQLPHKNRNNIKTLLRDKQVWIDGKAVSQYNHVVKAGQQVEIRSYKVPPETQYRGLTIVFEDPHLIIINKHEGLLSIATEKDKMRNAYSLLSTHVKKQNPINRIFVVHRLDRETSGLMVFAKSEKVQKLLQSTWGPTTKERVYLALIEGSLQQPKGIITSYLVESKALMVYSTNDPAKGQKAVTYYETYKHSEAFSLLKVRLDTGRKNQVRVHLHDLGHPVVGDRKYGSSIDPIGRLGLHAWVLAFEHPITGEKLRFESPIPRKFLSLF